MFLTQHEVECLTGYEKPGWQIRWLEKHKWNYTRAANGRVVISKAYAESRLAGIQSSHKPALNIAAIAKRA